MLKSLCECMLSITPDRRSSEALPLTNSLLMNMKHYAGGRHGGGAVRFWCQLCKYLVHVAHVPHHIQSDRVAEQGALIGWCGLYAGGYEYHAAHAIISASCMLGTLKCHQCFHTQPHIIPTALMWCKQACFLLT